MTVKECYEKLEGSYADMQTRLPDDNLIEKFLLKFPGDETMEKLREAVSKGDIKESFSAAHTLKGISANLAFDKLTKAVTALTEQLRPLTNQADPELLEETEKAYKLVISVLTEYKKNSKSK